MIDYFSIQEQTRRFEEYTQELEAIINNKFHYLEEDGEEAFDEGIKEYMPYIQLVEDLMHIRLVFFCLLKYADYQIGAESILDWDDDAFGNICITSKDHSFSPEDIYDILKHILPSYAESAIALIESSVQNIELLLSYFKNGEKDKFISLMIEAPGNYGSLHKICQWYEQLTYDNEIKYGTDLIEMCMKHADSLKKMELGDTPEHVLAKEALALIDIFSIDINDESDIETINTEVQNRSATHKLSYEGMYYMICHINGFKLLENQLARIQDLFHTQSLEPWYKEAEEFATALENEESNSFAIPEDFFAEYRSKSNFHKKYTLRFEPDTKTFEEFVNFLAEQDYINQDCQSKWDFVKSFTGRKDIEGQNKCEWKKPFKVLLYLIKEFYDTKNEKGAYIEIGLRFTFTQREQESFDKRMNQSCLSSYIEQKPDEDLVTWINNLKSPES